MRASDCPTVDTTEFLLAALEQASEAVVIIDADLRVRHFNAVAESIWGIARGDILGLDARCLGLTDLPPNSEITIRHGDGSRLRAAVSVSRVEIGGRSQYMVFVRDITAEVERRERIALLNLVADKTTRAVVVTDRNLRVVYTNAAFSGMFGYSDEEAQGRQANQLLAGRLTDRKTLLRLRRRICDGRGDEEEVLAYDRNGDEIWVSATVKAFRNDRGRIKYVFALLSDISENKQLRSLQQLIMGALADELPLTEIADQLCRRVEVIAPDVVASVLHVDSDGLVHPLGGPSLPDDYSRALEGVAIGPDVGSCGSAAYYGKPVLAEDIDTDPRWQPYKTRPLEVGLKACWSTPIKAKDGRVIGTFAFYFRESRAPSRWHQRIVDACVHLGALAIERKEARAQIARLAYHDMLTGLPNRAQLLELINRGHCGLSRGKTARPDISRPRSLQGRQRHAGTFGGRRPADRVYQTAARPHPAVRPAGAPERRRVRHRVAELRSGARLAGRLQHHRSAGVAAVDRQPAGADFRQHGHQHLSRQRDRYRYADAAGRCGDVQGQAGGPLHPSLLQRRHEPARRAAARLQRGAAPGHRR